jgi:tetratricopeptide (TPR) repeat protein
MEPSEPSFDKIAELFKLPKPPSPDEIKANPRKKHGETPEESDALGAQSLGDGDYETAIRHFKEAVAQRDPNDITSVINLAGAYDATDQYPQAYRQYEKALRAQKDAPEPHIGLSDLLRRYGRFRDAVEELQRAIEREPGNAFYHMKLAETLREMGERKRALASAQRAITIKPDTSFYHYWVGDLLIEMNRNDEALDSLRAAIELSPGDDFLYLRTAVAFWKTGKRPEAVKALRLASDLDPSKHVYHGLLEELLREMGQDEEANLETERATKMDRFDDSIMERTLAEMGIG